MNFLGHLYFSNNDSALMQANLFGDFVRGSNLNKYPEKIQQGIILHRKIDDYIDHHPAVISLLHQLYESLPKVSGIAVDLYFDHLLAKKWGEFHPQSLEEFTSKFYQSIDASTEFYTPDFQVFLARMQEHNWLHHYQFLEGLEKSCLKVSQRISFPNKLMNGVEVYSKFQIEIEVAFYEYMKDAKSYFVVM